MSENLFILPIGFNYGGSPIKTLPVADTGSEAEAIFTKKPRASELYNWFAQVLSAAVFSVGDIPVSTPFLADRGKTIPEAIKQIPLLDVGTLLLQVQCKCWEPVIEECRITCTQCGEPIVADIELNKVDIPENPGEIKVSQTVKLSKTYETILTEDLKMSKPELVGAKYNHVVFRVPTLGDAMALDKINADEVAFWRKLAFDCIEDFYYLEEGATMNEAVFVGKHYLNVRSMQLFNSDWNSLTLKTIRKELMTALPSAKYFYEDRCPSCDRNTPYFAKVSNFFRT